LLGLSAPPPDSVELDSSLKSSVNSSVESLFSSVGSEESSSSKIRTLFFKLILFFIYFSIKLQFE